MHGFLLRALMVLLMARLLAFMVFMYGVWLSYGFLWCIMVLWFLMVSYGFFMVSAYSSPQILVWVALTCGRLAALAWLAAPGQACMVGLAVVVLR